MSRFCIIPVRVLDDDRFTISHLRVIAAIGTFTDKNGWCHPSVSTIAKLARVSRQWATRCIADLKEWGYLEVYEQFRKDGGQSSNRYRVLFDVGMPMPNPGGDVFADVSSEDTPLSSAVDTPLSSIDLTPPVKCTLDTNDPIERPNEEKKKKKKKEEARARETISFDYEKAAFVGLTDEQVTQWAEAFPAVDVPLEIKRAAAWLDANPANRKRNLKRFLVNWLTRAQEKAPRVVSTRRPANQHPAKPAASKSTDLFDPNDESTWGYDAFGRYCPQKYLADKKRAFFERQQASNGKIIDLEVM